MATLTMLAPLRAGLAMMSGLDVDTLLAFVTVVVEAVVVTVLVIVMVTVVLVPLVTLAAEADRRANRRKARSTTARRMHSICSAGGDAKAALDASVRTISV
eukprot:CAMPEP_0180444648 /NCGR_PEP_ID=MMETSP1036_2-20121128/15290_1 /TAXON_ID=632150 /ORGANISM="Azadinium spinosum, Strain 3D9" /LENGTH=100 /DNA_ID=CAMNT_0022450981 /DNA_START=143 /DNA_END=445 /DNA_ORIENTATION=+